MLCISKLTQYPGMFRDRTVMFDGAIAWSLERESPALNAFMKDYSRRRRGIPARIGPTHEGLVGRHNQSSKSLYKGKSPCRPSVGVD